MPIVPGGSVLSDISPLQTAECSDIFSRCGKSSSSAMRADFVQFRDECPVATTATCASFEGSARGATDGRCGQLTAVGAWSARRMRLRLSNWRAAPSATRRD